MKLIKFLWCCIVITLVSCGSQKKVIKATPKKTITEKKVVRKPTVVEITPVKVYAEEIKKEEVKKIPEPVIDPVIVEVPEVKITKYSDDPTQDYINTYADIAVKEMHAYKIPASITLAQGILESGSGRSVLAIKSNNHFGIKCHKGWKGNSVSHDDDEIGECFRKYKHPETSYEDHSKFLTSRSRYASLFKLDLRDYKGWAYGLKRAGYATDSRYPRKLIAIIEKYNLQAYDTAIIDPYAVYEDVIKDTVRYTHIVSKGDTLYSLSKKYSTTVQKIKDINGLRGNTLSIDQELMIP